MNAYRARRQRAQPAEIHHYPVDEGLEANPDVEDGGTDG